MDVNKSILLIFLLIVDVLLEPVVQGAESRGGGPGND